MIKVKFTANLKRFFSDLEAFDLRASSVSEALDIIDAKYPGIKDYIVDEQGKLRQHVNIFIDNQSVKDKINLRDKLSPGDEVHIIQALSGG